MRKAHRLSEQEARECDVDEETKRIRRERRLGKRVTDGI